MEKEKEHHTSLGSVDDAVYFDVDHDENKQRRIIKGEHSEYPTLDTPNTIFESSNSSNHFNGLPLTPGIVTESIAETVEDHTKSSIFYSPSLQHQKDNRDRKHSKISVVSTAKDGEKSRVEQIITARDLLTISISSIILSIVAAVVVVIVYVFDIISETRTLFTLIIVIIILVFSFIIMSLCVKIYSIDNNRILQLNEYRKREKRRNTKDLVSSVRTRKKSRGRSASKIRTWSKGDLLGCGSFGKVYMALDHQSLQMFVVKQVELIKDINNDNIFIENIKSIQNEIKTLSKLSHPNIVRYLGSSKTNNHLNIFLEYMSGGSIAQMLSMFGPFELALVKSYTAQILNGLAFLHSQNIIHRDIKGSNILVNPDGCLKLADFGVSFSFENQIKQTLPSSLHGTAHWMAPEVISQFKYDFKADIWSMGITILEMITGRPPWHNKDAISVMYLIRNKILIKDDEQTKEKEIDEINDNNDYIHYGIKLPKKLKKDGILFVKNCLQRNPKNRPSAKSLLLNHPFLHNIDHDDNDSDDDDNNNEDDNTLKCINDVKQIVTNRIEYHNKARKELLQRKFKRDIYKKTQKTKTKK